ncbi:cytochrome c oxidase assembly protein [Methylocystis parvus]|uniref:Cytochrome c oxidase assembly protein CtaG n=1 Tax=Methylocystis parvus TaxID=134 RepID=A0A6B8LVH1_9HYPH|nr:cytochrome c oxidase assembly protein [Methylocystis parvus]QGM96387.1 cytochrome c oxidase assembly protein [Methylocystis parvus]WBJ99770.1 cytochrome c oxidase assembly protein [Methylocystis parvus OBBP]
MTEPDRPNKKSPRAIAAALVVGSVGMLGLSFASVPLYRAFCAATGFGGTPQIAKANATKQGERRLTVRFDANVARDLPWRFEPEVAKISLRTGETTTVYYKVVNNSDKETSGQAAYNVSPDQAGAFFVKVACFCFDEQRLAPHETAEWPVVFYLDPALEKDEAMRRVEEITLSYSFYPTRTPSKAKTSEAAGQKPKS